MYFCLPLFLSNSGLSDKRLPLAQISLHPFLNSHGITLWRSWSTDQEITILAKTFSWLTSMLLIIHSYSLTKVVLSLRFISWTILNNSCSFFFSVPPLPPPPQQGILSLFTQSVLMRNPAQLDFDFTGPCVFPPCPLLCFTGQLESMVNVMSFASYKSNACISPNPK